MPYGFVIDVAVMDEPGVSGGASPPPARTPPAMTAVLPFALDAGVAVVRV